MTAPGPAAPPPYPLPPGADGSAAPVALAPETSVGVPAPPAGPGVAPPFAAPPTEGRSVRVWLGLGAGALAVVLCCGAGGAALVGLAVSGSQAVEEQARAVVGDYYQAISDREYADAYELLCEQLRDEESGPEFERRVGAEPAISSYRVGAVDLTGPELSVPVDVVFSGGSQDTQQVSLAQDTSTGSLEVCGVS